MNKNIDNELLRIIETFHKLEGKDKTQIPILNENEIYLNKEIINFMISKNICITEFINRK